MGDLIQFRPRSNQAADRAFWKGRELTPIEQMAIEIMSQVDTAPSEYSAPPQDSA